MVSYGAHTALQQNNTMEDKVNIDSELEALNALMAVQGIPKNEANTKSDVESRKEEPEPEPQEPGVAMEITETETVGDEVISDITAIGLEEEAARGPIAWKR